MEYTLFLQGSAAKKEWYIENLNDVSNTTLYHKFLGFQMPEDAIEGEYRYAIIPQIYDAEYILKDNLLDSIVVSNGKSCRLEDLRPEVGLMRYGNAPTGKQTIRETNNTYYYRKKNG